MGRTWRFARIAGVDIRGDVSLLFLAFLLTFELNQFFSSGFVFRGGPGPFAFAVITTVLFIASILAHELAHAIAFRSRGIPVLGITLYMLGGFTQGGSEAKTPGDEFLVAVVGPLTTLALGVLFYAAHALIGERSSPWWGMFGYLGNLNLIIAVFNLLPGFPLDGGRVALAGLWKLTHSRSRGTMLAARAGQVVASLIVFWGVYLFVAGSDALALWPVIIGLMLFQGSTAAISQGRGRRAMEGIVARQVMSPPPPTIPAEWRAGEALERYLNGHDGEAFPVVDAGHVVGFLSGRMARGVGPEISVRSAMTGTDAVAFVGPDESMADVTQRMATRQARVALVEDGGRLIGVIEPEDLDRFVRRGRQVAGPPAAVPPRPDA